MLPSVPAGGWGPPRNNFAPMSQDPGLGLQQPLSHHPATSPQPASKLNLPTTSPSFSINLPTTQPLPAFPAPSAVSGPSEHGPGHGSGGRGATSEPDGGEDDRSVDGSPGLEGESGGKPARKKSKRPRQVLSCTMCVRRKTKCDKIHPCTACVKRGDPQGCHIETGDEPPSKQPFALNADMIELKARVKQLEGVVQDLTAALRQATSGQLQLPAPRPYPQIKIEAEHGRSFTSNQYALPPGQRHEAADEESVAAVLQQLREGSPTHQGRADSNSFEAKINQLLAQLPNRKMCDTLVASFFARVDWQIHVLHGPLFHEEYSDFWPSVATFAQQGFAPAWLATLFVVIALGLRYSPSSSSPERVALAGQWVAAAEAALVLGDCHGRPQARSVQVVILLAHYWHSVAEIDRVVQWVGAGVRIAQALGLQNSDKAPLDFSDDHFRVRPQSRAFFNAELGTKLWWGLCWLDWDVAYRCRNVTVLKLEDFSTIPPSNVSDEEMLEGPVVPRPFSSPTVSTAMALFANLLTVQHSWPIPRGTLVRRGMTNEAVLALDRLFRDVNARFPPYFDLAKANDSATKMIDAAKPYIQYQRLNLNKEANARFVRLHRNALYADDWTSPDVDQSRRYGRASCEALLTIVAEFRQCSDFADALWWVPAYSILTCSLLLVYSLFHRSKGRVPDGVSPIDKIRASLEALKKSSSAHSKEGTRIVELLLEEHDAGRSGEGLGLHPGGGREEEPKEIITPGRWSRWKEVVDLIANATMCAGEPERANLHKLKQELEQAKHKYETDQTLSGLQPPPSLVPPGPHQAHLQQNHPPTMQAHSIHTQPQGFVYPPGAGLSHYLDPNSVPVGMEQYAGVPIDPTQPISPMTANRTLDNFFRELGLVAPAGMVGTGPGGTEWPQGAGGGAGQQGMVVGGPGGWGPQEGPGGGAAQGPGQGNGRGGQAWDWQGGQRMG